jgi:hypothetical protein
VQLLMIQQSELHNPWPGLLLCVAPFALCAGLAVALVVYARELVEAIRENGWRDFDRDD